MPSAPVLGRATSVRTLDVPADPLRLARRVWHAVESGFGVAFLHRAEPRRVPNDVRRLDRWSFIALSEREQAAWLPSGVGALDVSSARSLFSTLAGESSSRPTLHALCAAPRFVGVLPYEARRDLERAKWVDVDKRARPPFTEPKWITVGAVACVDHDSESVCLVAFDDDVGGRLAAALSTPDPDPCEGSVLLVDGEAPERHIERVAAARELIAAGDLYQVNLSRRLELTLNVNARIRRGALFSSYERLIRSAPTPLGALLSFADRTDVLSSSPELLLDIDPSPDGFELWTAPIKGTRPRAANEADDRRRRDELDADEKERAELTMIVDVERNDLGQLARVGSVELAAGPAVVTHATVHHREAWLRAIARPEVTLEHLTRAMVPSGSVTGAPKVRAMEVIASLEPHRRGLYTGGIGMITAAGAVRLSMAIRTAVFDDARGEYLTGGGIVMDSDPARELEETRWKSKQLRAMVAGPATYPKCDM